MTKVRDTPRVLTTQDVADAVGVNRKVVQRALASGELVGYQRSARAHYRIDRSDLDDWIRGEQPRAAA